MFYVFVIRFDVMGNFEKKLRTIPDLRKKETKGLVSLKVFFYFHTIALSFVFDNYCLTIDQLDSKDSSRKLQSNGAISYF